MSSNAAVAQDQFPVGRVVVLGGEAAQRRELAEAVRALGHEVNKALEAGPADTVPDDWAGVDAVVILAEERDARWASLVKTIDCQPAPPPFVVLGPQSGSSWRRRALKAGAFVCAARDVPTEELQSILSAAMRYRLLEREVNLLRIECERICLGLLKSYGEAATSLKDTAEEVEALQRNLSDIRNQIIRAFV